MSKYNFKEYLEYVKQQEIDVPGAIPISFEDWKLVQPILDEKMGKPCKTIGAKENLK